MAVNAGPKTFSVRPHLHTCALYESILEFLLIHGENSLQTLPS